MLTTEAQARHLAQLMQQLARAEARGDRHRAWYVRRDIARYARAYDVPPCATCGETTPAGEGCPHPADDEDEA